MRRFANYWLPGLLLAACLEMAAGQALAADGYVIRLTPDKQIEVVTFRPPSSGRVTNQTGIAVWRQGSGEQWASLPGKLPTGGGSSSRLAVALNSSTRGGAAAGLPMGTGQATFQPDQLLGTVIVRAAETSFLTPADQGHHLEPKITIRRRPAEGDEPFPAVGATLRAEGQEPLTLEFAAGQSTIRWAELADLPDGLKNGLPPGECSLQLESGPLTNFVVEEAEERDWVLKPLAELGELLGRDDPLYVVVAVGELLDQTDDDGKPRQYLADAFDLADAAINSDGTSEDKDEATAGPAWLAQFHERLRQRLLGQKEETPADVAPTGIETIDRARLAIAAGNLRAANAALNAALVDTAPRTRGLALLYRGVVAGESDAADRTQADVLFQQASGLLADASAEDRFRLHNNYASVLFGRARDQVHNHAFQMATGASRPLFNAVSDWSAALKQYQLAQQEAAELSPALSASVQINVAQLYSLLADLIAVLDYSPDGERKFAAGEAAATAAAAEAAQKVLADNADQLDPLSRGAAHEMLAQLAYRAEDDKTCVEQAALARAEYLAAGSLAGVESVERLWGLALTRPTDESPTGDVSDEGLKHLQTSHLLADVLRSRIPEDQAGVSRAGFLARRGYVNERLIELSISRQEYAAALAYAEGGKARSLQDLFQARNIAASQTDDSRELAEIVADWPADVVAVEYFLGTMRSWVFAISTSGEVRAWPLVDADGQPVASRELVRRVQQLTSGMEGQAAKLFRSASAGKGFDHAWQDELHDFYNILWPAPLRELLHETKTVVVVPHHILHYFPFAALVTEVDPAPRGKLDQPQPRFLVEEQFALCKAPSLVAWDMLRRKPAAFSRVQAVGIVEFDQAGRLPGVEHDLANLKRIFAGDLQQVVAAREATEGRIQEVLQQPGMLFIGTHGKNLPDRPLASFLLCHGDQDHDGQLTAGEIFAGQIGANLVVMSACYSGLADRSPLPGDDLFGLERALLTAGASSVVSGLWDVYDDTGPLLMADFLNRLHRQEPVAAALAGAQRAFLAKCRKEGPGDPWIHPYFWSVYSLAGSERTVFESKGRP